MNRQEYLEEQDHYSWYIIAIVTLSVKAVTIIFLAIILAADSVLPKTTIGEGQKKCNVMITFTSCKRYDLFERTIKSILYTWNDLQMIDYWYCIDDNSSYEDRQKMRSMFPWIDFYMKSNQLKIAYFNTGCFNVYIRLRPWR